MTTSSDIWVLTAGNNYFTHIAFLLTFIFVTLFFALKMQPEPLFGTCPRESVPINLSVAGDSSSLMGVPRHPSRTRDAYAKGFVNIRHVNVHCFRPPPPTHQPPRLRLLTGTKPAQFSSGLCFLHFIQTLEIFCCRDLVKNERWVKSFCYFTYTDKFHSPF